MQKEVLAQLAAFLEAIPAQVEAWDKPVIDYLCSHANVLQAFRRGNPAAKWNIYADIRYGRQG